MESTSGFRHMLSFGTLVVQTSIGLKKRNKKLEGVDGKGDYIDPNVDLLLTKTEKRNNIF
jgi:hypothetical protein